MINYHQLLIMCQNNFKKAAKISTEKLALGIQLYLKLLF